MKTAAMLLGLALISVGPVAAAAPSILLITADTLRADHLGTYGYFRPTAPAIERLSRESIVFENAYAPMAMTLPSHLALMTSAYPLRHGILSNLSSFPRRFTGDGLVPAAEIFRRAGYATAAFTSSSPLSAETGIDLGFQTFEGPPSDTEGRPRLDLPAEATAQKALAWLTGAPRPFFLWVHFFDPHDPYQPPEPFDRAYVNEPELFGFLRARGFRRADHAQAAVFANGYDGEILYMDGQIERLFAALRAHGLYDDTLIVFAGDHGEGLLQHGRPGHGFVWNNELHVPLIIKLPGGTRVERRAGLASLVDVLPTIAAQANVALPARLDGIDLLREERQSLLVQRTAGIGRKNKQYAVVENEWKYVASVGARQPDALYHLTEDPNESQSVIERFPDRAARMRGQVLAMIGEIAPDQRQADPVSPAQRERLRQLGYDE